MTVGSLIKVGVDLFNRHWLRTTFSKKGDQPAAVRCGSLGNHHCVTHGWVLSRFLLLLSRTKDENEDDLNQSPSPRLKIPLAFSLFYCFPFTSASTTCGSARVDVSPIWSTAFSAILRKMRRMILPERVLGRPVAN